jgi:diguanylate cyclase (GGDEF)-like protein
MSTNNNVVAEPLALRVLIVNDSPEDATLMAQELTNSKFPLSWERVDNENDYLLRLETLPDLILADYTLPQFSAVQALELLQRRGLSIPFIVVSGTIGEHAAVDMIKAIGLAEMLAMTLANVRLRDKLKEQSIRDPLTRLYNRRYLEDSLLREISRARRAGSKIGVMMVDVDNFKQFNDSFGHLTGDELLRALGVYLKSYVRPEDIPSRYGGEEFTLVLPGASSEIMRARAETLRKGFRCIPLDRAPSLDKGQRTISLSLGVAVFPDNAQSVEGLLRAADEALYQVKMDGKDRVVVSANGAPATPDPTHLPV